MLEQFRCLAFISGFGLLGFYSFTNRFPHTVIYHNLITSNSHCMDDFFNGISHVNVVLDQFYNAPTNEFQAKLVLKPLAPDRRWKFMYEPIHQDVRLLSKKIPVTKFLNLQVWCFYIPFSVYKEYKCIYTHTHTHRERERERGMTQGSWL